jgi:hypothetical protein
MLRHWSLRLILSKMIYGYSKKIVNEYGLHELSLVSFQTDAKTLRRIIAFLSDAADELEKKNGCMKEAGDHLHLRDEDENWEKDFPDSDVIVLYPFSR